MASWHPELGSALMSFSWGYVWRQWRATLQVEPLFLDPAGNLTHAGISTSSESRVLVEGDGASIGQSPATCAPSRGAHGRSGPTKPRNPAH